MMIDFPSTSQIKNTKRTVGEFMEQGQADCAAAQRSWKRPIRPACVTLTSMEFKDPVPKKRNHAAEPIKDINDIISIQDYLIQNGRYRDNFLFTMGINVGLRCGDLLQLKVGQILSDDGTAYRSDVTVIEQKTGKERTFYLNDAVCDAADLYFENCGSVAMNDYLFRCEGNRGKNSEQPLAVKSVERILKEVINEKCGLELHASTHCLRKTFAYHMIMSAPDRSRAIEFLQKILGHSSAAVTLMYAGITDQEVEETYRALNLGRRNPFGWSFASQSAG